MFLYQKLKYNIGEDTDEMLRMFRELNPNYVVYDTETTGLNIMIDKPFLISVGFGHNAYVFEPTVNNIENFRQVASEARILLAHNAKYDFHMMLNIGVNMSEYRLGDSMVVARLTSYADERTSLSLAALGEAHVSKDAKFAAKVIKKKLTEINRQRRKVLRDYVKEHHKKDYRAIMDAYDNRVQFVSTPYDSILSEMDTIYKEPNYFDVYLENKELMKSYALDDVVIMLEYLKKSLPVLAEVDPNLKTFKRESEVLVQVAHMERVGLKADVEYILESRDKVIAYRDKKYEELKTLAGVSFTAGQHKFIKELYKNKYGINLEKSDEKALKEVTNINHEDAARLADIILELRTIEKWLSTYIEGMLNRVSNGRVHTSIKNTGAVSGRVSSDMQQQPKEALLADDGSELFHPRRVFINDEGYRTFYFDYSQMELRLQAQYTIWTSEGDVNLCRAYIPFKCTSLLTGDIFNPESDLEDWNSGEWEDENGNLWEPIDLHCVTTHKAFPDLPYVSLSNNELNPPEFKKMRKYGKMTNFLKNYMGGVDAIVNQVGVDMETAERLDKSYYEAFPNIRAYQQWVNNELHKLGHIENIYGRRYYMRDTRAFYKATNYLVQGGCADMVKEKQVILWKYFESHNLKSKIILPVHDEVQILIPKEEEYLIPIIKSIMEDAKDVVPHIPMICDVEVTDTNWAEKHGWSE